MVWLVNEPGSVPVFCSQWPGLTTVLHPAVVKVVSWAFALLSPCETQWIYRNLLVGTFLLCKQEYCAADSYLKTKMSKNTSSQMPLLFRGKQNHSVPFWVPGSRVQAYAGSNAQFLQGKPHQDAQDPSENSVPLSGSANACNNAHLKLRCQATVLPQSQAITVTHYHTVVLPQLPDHQFHTKSKIYALTTGDMLNTMLEHHKHLKPSWWLYCVKHFLCCE